MKCEFPEEQRGKIFLDLETELLCDQPMVIRLGIQDIQPFSVFVSWQGRNRSGLYGYQVAYYSMDISTEVCNLLDFVHCYSLVFKIKRKVLSQSARSLKLTNLNPGARYRICVSALGNWVNYRFRPILRNLTNQEEFESFQDEMLPFLMNSSTSKCTEVTY